MKTHNTNHLDLGTFRQIVSPLSPVNDDARLLIQGGTIVSMDPGIGDLERADILLQGTKILAVGKGLSSRSAQVIDASNMIVMPGFVDSHRHAWEGQLRRIAPDSSTLLDYLQSTHFSFATAYRPADIYLGNLATSLAAIDGGITTMVDNSHNTRSLEHANAAIDALEDAGIRAVYAPGAPLAGEWDSASWAVDLEYLARGRLRDSTELVTMAMMSQWDRENWALARRLKLRIITEFLGREMGELLPVLHAEGLLGPDNIFNHNTGLTDSEWQILREAGVQINVCPRSDAQYGLEEGVHTLQRALDHGISPAISIDVEASYGGDMFSEMRVAFFVQRAHAQAQRYAGHQKETRPVDVRTILAAATIDGARVAGLEDRTGTLTPGKQADLVLIRTDDLNLYPSNHAIGTVVHAADRSNVDTVIVDGRVRKLNGRILGIDHTKLRAAIDASCQYLFEQTGYLSAPFARHSPQFNTSAATT
ncbi:amidohydrolase family protein [Cupriavidus pauculus]|uniref:amidohydrolase family protein n=1 Tax=Cupriavidus pauculus TaxID=82633 RepID=UPI001FD2BC2C|nr:amidohydrolase family protein [Cupriavidus pauculus]